MSYAGVTDTINSMKTQTNAVNYERNKANGNDTVNQDVFLQLMITQLQYQDPLDPMDNTDFLSQQAMFSQVTTLQDMNSNLTKYGDALLSMNNTMLGSTTLSQAMGIVGKQVEAVNPDNPEETISGIVDSVKITDNGIVFSVSGKEISSDNIKSINNVATQPSNISTDVTSEADSSLKESAKDFLSDILANPKLKSAATNLIEKLAGKLL